MDLDPRSKARLRQPTNEIVLDLGTGTAVAGDEVLGTKILPFDQLLMRERMANSWWA